MKYENKDLFLLIWNRYTGKHDKFIVNPSLQQNEPEEYHIVLGQKLEE